MSNFDFPQPQPGVSKRRRISEIATGSGSPGLALFFLLAVAAALAVPSASYADGIPAAVIEVTAVGGTPILTAGTVTGTACNGSLGCETSTMTVSYAGGSAAASGSGSASGENPANSGGTGVVTYYFSVDCSIATCPSELVPLIFTGSGSTSASGPDTEALGQFYTPGGALYACSATGYAVGVCGSEPSSFSGSVDYNAVQGGLYDIEIIASGSSSLGTASWTASVDPMIEIDPNFADASDFSLEFSPNPPSVPEPSTFLLLGTGLLGMAGAFSAKKLWA